LGEQESNGRYRRFLLSLSLSPRRIFNHFFKLREELARRVNLVKSRFRGHVIGLQIRQARECGKISLEGNLGNRVRTHAYLTEEHEELFYDCAHTLKRGARGNATFFLATDIPAKTRPQAAARLGKDRVVVAELPDEDVHETRARMEDGRAVNFEGAFLDIWLLGECDEVITTPASSFGYIAMARKGAAPVTVTKWGKCLRPLTSEPFSHGWLLVQKTSCFDRRMLVPEHDMLCQDCVVLECPCGDLTCASHTEHWPPLFPRQVAQVPG